MPEISRFLGVVIRMHFDEHGPPHFHAAYGDDEAAIRIESIGLLAGDLPPRALALVIEWARLHQGELLENWFRLRAGQGPDRIAPLE
jgi:hypothetical protein